MRKVRIFGGPATKSFSLREENADVSPTYFEWAEEGDITNPVFLVDGEIQKAEEHIGHLIGPNCFEKQKIVALLVEPSCLHPENYQAAFDLHHCFSHVLTYDKEWYDKMNPLVGNTRMYFLGGSSIAFDKWGIYPKSKDVCMFLSDKKTTEGHKLRHKIAEEFGDRIDVYRNFDNKFDILKDYRYCVVVESCQNEHYFSEKLLDCLSVGAIPIYSGALWIEDYFNYSGFVEVLDNDYFRATLEACNKISYDAFLSTAKQNLILAHQYRIMEDWIFEHYPDLFEEQC